MSDIEPIAAAGVLKSLRLRFGTTNTGRVHLKLEASTANGTRSSNLDSLAILTPVGELRETCWPEMLVDLMVDLIAIR